MFALAGSLESGLITNLMFDQNALMSTTGIVTGLDSTELRNGNIDHMNLTSNVNKPYSDKKPTAWDGNTILNATFDNGGIGAGNVDFFSAQISKILIQRQRVYKDRATDWLTVYEYTITEDISETQELTFNIQDRLTAHGETYKYRFLPVLQQGEVQLQILGGESDPITATFDGVFICDAYKSYRLYGEVSYDSTTYNQEAGVHNTLGSKYPIVVMNSNLNYQAGGINGLILPDGFGEIEPRIKELNNIYCVNDCWTTGAIEKDYMNIEEKRITLDRHEMVTMRNEIMDFLTDKRPKVIKDWNGNIWEVMFTGNPTVNYVGNWGMGLANLNAQWTEIGNVNDEDSLRYAGLLGN